MNVGTKSLLFGAHQILLHPLLVILAWRKLYGTWPAWRELLAIAIHDWGYWGSPEMDGEHGLRHPELGAVIAEWILGSSIRDMILYHSRSFARNADVQPSKLCAPDKLASALFPRRLYVALTELTGEIEEYRKNAAKYHDRTGKGVPLGASNLEWWNWMADYMQRVAREERTQAQANDKQEVGNEDRKRGSDPSPGGPRRVSEKEVI